ncbi:MAG TPA: hypothetical protein DCL43_03405 [Chitinophagaceae bacterium]|nr:hypothetical protein [Chitinophagaceae bacterium]HAN39377.1 hypothetical protein [Chitinophagaceae bacterium]
MKINYPEALTFLQAYYTTNNTHLAKLGGYKDGGYVTDFRAVQQAKLLISGGVGSNVRFESDFHEINDTAQLLLIDPTVSILRMIVRGFYHFTKPTQSGFRSLSEVLNFLYLKKHFTLVKKYLGTQLNINELIQTYAPSLQLGQVFLKLDIEGFEYELLSDILANKAMFGGICIEFHNLEIAANIEKIKSFLEQLSFNIVHISINEACMAEHQYPSLLEISLSPKNADTLFSSYDSAYYLQNANMLHNKTIVFG